MTRAIAAIVVVALAGVAHADHRIAVRPFTGPHAAAFERDVVEAVHATAPDHDGVLSGTVERRGGGYVLHLELRDAAGDLVGTRVATAIELRDEVAHLIGDLDVSITDDAEPPLRVSVECEGEGRTKACPAFLLGFIDAHDVLHAAPRSDADVVLYASVTEVARVDRLHLRFVGSVAGAPSVVESDVDLDTRSDDDTQRDQLEPAFLRGIALFVAARHPEAVAVMLGSPAVTEPLTDTSPWDLKLELGGSGNWTDQYQTYNGSSTLAASYLEPTARVGLALHADGGINRQPALVLPDGRSVSIDTSQWHLGATLDAARLLDDHWSLGGTTAISRDDPEGQYDYSWIAKGGIEWDAYPANDPRGNRLAFAYMAGYQADGYRLRNVLGETAARYPIHQLSATGTVRKDRVGIGIALAIGAELLAPARRNHVSASPFIEWKLGAYVDLDLALSITRRELPAPDPALIDPTNYGLLSRLSYAEPLAINGSLNLTIHSDRTNGARNDRFTDL